MILEHAKRRLFERFGLESVPQKRIIKVRPDGRNNMLCKFHGTKIYFILREADNKILTFLTQTQMKIKYKHPVSEEDIHKS